MAKTVYLETSVFGAYVSTRDDPGSVYRRVTTRSWWSRQRASYEVCTSAAVLTELQASQYPGQDEAIGLAGGLPQVDITDEVLAVAELYVRHKLMPKPASGDALHLALASVNEMDYLLTWNIRHLANPNKIDHMTVINSRLGLLGPAILTPENLWLEEPVP